MVGGEDDLWREWLMERMVYGEDGSWRKWVVGGGCKSSVAKQR